MTPYHANPIAAMTAIIISLVIWTPLFIGAAVGNGFIAARLGKSVALWVILSLIPIFNFFFLYYVGYVVVLRILGRLDNVVARLENGGIIAATRP
jgi:hypothetical protein